MMSVMRVFPLAALMLTFGSAANAETIAAAGRVNPDNQGQNVIWHDDKGDHVMVGGDPQHGIYKNPSEDHDQSSIKCADTAYGCAYPPPPPHHQKH